MVIFYTHYHMDEADHRGSHIGKQLISARGIVRIGKYLNHCFIIVVFLWSSSTYDPHINNSGQDSLTKTFFELQFRSRLEACLYTKGKELEAISGKILAIKGNKLYICINCKDHIRNDAAADNSEFKKCSSCSLSMLKESMSSTVSTNIVIMQGAEYTGPFYCSHAVP